MTLQVEFWTVVGFLITFMSFDGGIAKWLFGKAEERQAARFASLEQSLQQLSDQGWLIPWTSEQERHAFTRMIMDSHIVWIKNSFYREAQDQISYADFLDIHWYLLQSHVQKEKLTEYLSCRKTFFISKARI